MDLSKLSDDQLSVAVKIAQKAEEKGLSPDFVLPMVMAESGFNQSAKSRTGAIGVMQIQPSTADQYNCKNPQDLDANIDCGLNVLKDLVSRRNIGSDPYKVLAGYNAGPGTKFLESGNLEDLPKETLDHMVNVSGHYGGDLPNVLSGKATEAKDSRQQAPEIQPLNLQPVSTGIGTAKFDPTRPIGFGQYGDQASLFDKGPDISAKYPADTVKSYDPLTDPSAPSNKRAAEITGAVSGAGLAGGVETLTRGVPFVREILSGAREGTSAFERPTSEWGLTRYISGQLPNEISMSPKQLSELTGLPVRTPSEAQAAIAAIKGRASERVENIIRNPKGQQTGRTFSYTQGVEPQDLSAYRRAPGLAGEFSEGTKALKMGVKGILPTVGRVGVGAVGGALSLGNLYDAYNMQNALDPVTGEKAGFSPRVGAKYLSGIGGGLMAIPTIPTEVVGAALQIPDLAYEMQPEIEELVRSQPEHVAMLTRRPLR